MLTNVDYLRNMALVTPTRSNNSMNWSRQFTTTASQQPAIGNQNKGPWQDWLQMDDEEIFQMAKNNLGSKLIHREVIEQEEFRNRFLRLLISGLEYEKLARLAMDGNANFIIQVCSRKS